MVPSGILRHAPVLLAPALLEGVGHPEPSASLSRD